MHPYIAQQLSDAIIAERLADAEKARRARGARKSVRGEELPRRKPRVVWRRRSQTSAAA